MNRDIAIIGISGRFPMARNLDDLFENLKQGKDCVDDISPQRVIDTTLPPDRPLGKCGFIDDIDKFDHKFFGISLAEAKNMGPEQRILLEITYACMENAGYSPASFSNTDTAVFVSTAFLSYHQHATERTHTLLTGNATEFLAARIGRFYNLKGTAAVIDTTCSSSLVAIHTACNEIISGDAPMALVAGVNLVLFPFADQPGGLDTEAPNGKSKAFSAEADGMSHGEIAVAVLLKPLEAALRDKDNIQAIIKGTAANYNGNASSAITAPDSRTQADVLLKAWKKAGIKATDLSYVEAHGSGTQLGDTLEFEALNLAFGEYKAGKHICPISTIKSNIGHTRYVSGLAGLIKTILSLKYKVLFPTIHFKKPNPLLDYENSAVYVNREYCAWETKDKKPRYAGVTSLGWSGTNCHVVLQEGPVPAENRSGAPGIEQSISYHIPLSGKTLLSLQQNAAELLAYLKKQKVSALEDISYTLATGRNHFEYRTSFVVNTIEELTAALNREVEDPSPAEKNKPGKLIFILSDSLRLTEAVIDRFTKYEAFKNAWKECESVMQIDTPALRDVSFQYSFYRLLIASNITADQLLPLGIGKIIQPIIAGDMDLSEGLAIAKNYKPEEISNTEGRVRNLLDRLVPEGNCTFLDMAAGGLLSAHLEKYDSIKDQVCFTGVDRIKENRDPLVHLIHILYSRHFNKLAEYPWSGHLTGKKVELPVYQFSKIRCWLRDTPKQDKKEKEADSHSKQASGEQPGHLENKLTELFASILGKKVGSLAADLTSQGLDKQKAAKAALGINALFNTSLSPEGILDLQTLSGLAAYIQKQLTTAQKIILVWEVILQNTNISLEDDFFELGGHSLMATQLIVLFRKEFGIDLNFEDIFSNPSVKELAIHVDSLKEKRSTPPVKQQIKPAPRQESYPLTYAQKRMWFLNFFVEGNSAYNNVFGIYLEGDLDYAMFDKAFTMVLERHESMRTIFRMTNDEPRQFVLNMDGIKFKTAHISLESSVDIEAVFNKEYKHQFDLSDFPLFRNTLIRTQDRQHICIFNIHHIISDGWSIRVFLEDFYLFYEQLLAGKTTAARELSIQIKDYAVWQQEEEFRQILNQQETYWLNRLKGPLTALSLPADYPRPAVQSFDGDALGFNIEIQQTEALKKIAKDSNATLYMVLLALYNVLLAKISNAEEVLVGSPVAGRRFDGLQPLIGLFVNTIVLKNAPSPDQSFAEFLSGLKQNTLEAFNNQDYPFEELVKKLLVERDTSRNPLFDAMFIWQNNREVREHFGDIKMSSYPVTTRTARVDLVMEAIETNIGIFVNFEFCTALFTKETIAGWVAGFRRIISAVLTDANQKIGEIEMISPIDKSLVLHVFNNTSMTFPADKTISAIFEERVRERSASIALTFEGADWSYHELNAGSNQLAASLFSKGVRKGSIIGIMMQRCPEMIISIMAILKAGCAYLPIDPEYPTDRIKHMVDDSGLNVVLTDGSLPGICSRLGEQVTMVDVNTEDHLSYSSENPAVDMASSDLAYLIYTSGSTGIPKGVMIGHNNVVNFVHAITEKIEINSGDTILCQTTISFDIFVLESILPLLTGAKIVLAGSDVRQNPAALARLIREQEVNCLQITPSHLKLLLYGDDSKHVLDDIEVLMVGGENFPAELLRQLKSHYKGKIYNMYGPTETTVWSTVQDLTDVNSVNIGKPIGNTTIRIIDANRKLQPVGVVGELCIGGAGVARGYWNRQALTSERFINDPYAENEIIYRTGDSAKWLPDGNIEYMGRIDNQVKIRGFRIEPGEIEARLLQQEGISDAVVIALEKEGGKYLVGYYVASGEIPANQLKSFLLEQVPYYMVPSWFVRLDSIPLTPNGKINRNALPDPQVKTISDHTDPVGEIETKLVEIWKDVLNLEKDSISVHDDFFISGGHSIIAVRLIHSIQQYFHVSLSLREIFEHATIQKQARLIEQSSTEHKDTIPRVGDRDFYPASSAQEGLFYECLLDKNNLSYNIFSIYKVEGATDINKIEKSFRVLIDRHESLRTSFALSGGQVIQKINQQVDFKLQIITAERSASVEEELEKFVRPFNLSDPSLIRCGLLQHGKQGNFLLVDLHHIVCDGLSLNLLMHDFKHIYRGGELPSMDLRYVDYACWQKEGNDELKKQKAYWLQQLSGNTEGIKLPVKRKRIPTGSYRVAQNVLEIDSVLHQRIKEFTASQNTSVYMFLLSVYNILLSKMCGSEDVIVGTDVAGRSHAAFQHIVGTFINVLPLRVQVQPESSFKDFLTAVKKCVLEAFDNQDLQFDQMMAMLQERNSGERKKIVDVHFSFANYLDNTVTDETFVAHGVEDYTMTTHYEFKVQVNEGSGNLRIAFIYSIDLYEPKMINLLKTYYYNILTAILDNCLIEIGHIELTWQPAL